MLRKGALQVSQEEFDQVRSQLKARSKDYNGKEVSFEVFKSTPQGYLIPRYFFGNDHLLSARSTQLDTRERRFPTFKAALWPEQESGVEQAIRILHEHLGVFLNARPGSGKTVAALYIACSLKPQKVLVLVDQDNLAEQWCERIKMFVPEAVVSFIMPLASQRALHKKFGQTDMINGIQHFDTRGDFIICMAQTYVQHERPLRVGLLIVDEAHVFSAPTFSQAVFNVNFNWSLALSATKERRDGNEWVFRKMLGTSYVQMRGKTQKARALFYGVNTNFMKWSDPQPNSKPDWFRCIWCKFHHKMTCRYECDSCSTAKELGTSEPKVLAQTCASLYKFKEYNEVSVERMLCDDPTYNTWIVTTLDTFLKADRDIFVFSRLRHHLEHLHKLISSSIGDVSGLYLGKATNNTARSANNAALKQRITLATYGKAGKGLDVQRKDGALFAGPVGRHSVEQVIGRIERKLEGKKRPVAVHAIIPFPTHVARMKGCINFYRKEDYDVRVEEGLQSKVFG